ncbi:MAG TPA: phage/plasmid primase, P4 family [Ruminococcus sp.]
MITSLNNGSYNGSIIYSADTQSYKAKPTGTEIGGIRNRLGGETAHRETSLQQLAKLIENGVTVQGAQLRSKQDGGENTDERFLRQQLFAVDLDNVYKDKTTGQKIKLPDAVETPEKILEISQGAGLTPCIIAESFSSTPELRKYHVLFAADKPVTDISQARQVILNLQDVFGSADEACKDPARILFGTTADKAVYVCNAVNTAESLLSARSAGSLTWDSVIDDKQDKAEKFLQSAFDRTEADPFRLLQMIDPNALSYEEWCRVTASYKLYEDADRSLWEAWNNQYSKVKPKADLRSYDGLTGKGVSKGTLKHFAKQHSPAEYEAYIKELRPAPSAKAKNKAASKKNSEQADDTQEIDKAAQRKEIMLRNASRSGFTLPEGELPPYIYEVYDNKGDFKGYAVSCPLLADYIRKHSNYIFVKNEAFDGVRRYWYINGCYRLISDDELKGFIKQYITAFDTTLLKMKDVNEVYNNLITDRNFIKEQQLNADENIINFRNGILRLDTMTLIPHSPQIMSTIQIPCNWNPQCCINGRSPVFDSFLDTFTESDKVKKDFLMQYIGVCISNIKGYRMKKALFMVGPGDTGKTQLKSLTEMLLGEENTSPADLPDLEKRFGSSALYGKRLVGSSDMSFATVSEIKLFKQITGGDEISIEKKCKDAFNYRYNGLLWFCTNELPKFGGDKGEWVYKRIIPFKCSRVIPEEQQDKQLSDKMFKERETIVYRAVMAARKVIENGYRFDIPEECDQALKDYELSNSPSIQFFEECCRIRPKGEIRDNCTTRRIHEAFRQWCFENSGSYVPKVPAFRKEISGHIGCDESMLRRKSGGYWFYVFTLTDEAKQAYGMFDGIQSA